MRQLSLRYQPDGHYSRLWTELLDELRVAADHIGLKQAAYDLDVSPSVLSNALRDRDRHAVKAEWLPYLIDRAPNNRVIEILAAIRRCEVSERRELTAEEQVAALKDAIAKNVGPRIQREIFDSAFGRSGGLG